MKPVIIILAVYWLSAQSMALVSSDQCLDDLFVQEYQATSFVSIKRLSEHHRSYEFYAPSSHRKHEYLMTYLLYFHGENELLRVPIQAELKSKKYVGYFTIRDSEQHDTQLITIYKNTLHQPNSPHHHCRISYEL